MKDEMKINALIDSVGLDAIVQDERIQEAFKKLSDQEVQHQWVTKKQAMHLFGVSASTIYRLQQRHGVRVNTTEPQRQKRYLKEDLIKALNLDQGKDV